MNIPNKHQSKSEKSNVADNTAVLPENVVKGNKTNTPKAQNIAFPPNVGIPNNIALQSTPSPSVSHNYLNQAREHSPYSQYLSPRSFSTQEKFVRDSMAT